MSVCFRWSSRLVLGGVVAVAAPPLISCASTPEPAPKTAAAPVVVVGFQTPESVLFDAERDVYWVSNINGAPGDKDDNGFISKLGPDGVVIDLKFIDGAKDDITLHAPKGSCIVGDALFVADIDVVRIFSLSTGDAAGEVPITGATFLNDVACGDGKVFVTDSGLAFGESGPTPTGTDAVYAIDPTSKAVAIVTQNPDLPRPNGIIEDGGALRVVYFGAGRMDAMTFDGTETSQVTFPKGALDGIVKDGRGGFYVSSWEASAVYHVGSDGSVVELKTGLNSPADIGLDTTRNVLLVPHFSDNTVELIPLD
jgi:hypothetical protein